MSFARACAGVSGLLLVALLGGFGWFVGQARRPALAEVPAADGIVALTGGAERVETALRLLAMGRARVLLVSGVGGSADLSALGRHAGLRPAELASMRDRITLGRGAASTHGNAVETAAWARENAVGSLVVVTADYHMPRAMAELSRALPAATLYPMPVARAPGAGVVETAGGGVREISSGRGRVAGVADAPGGAAGGRRGAAAGRAVRALLFAAWFVGVTVVVSSAAWVAIALRRPAPGPDTRALMRPVIKRWSRWVLAGLGPLCGIDWRVEGAGSLPAGGPALIAAQHQSTFETLLWMALLPDPAFVMKHELARLPLFGPLTRRAGMILVDRSAGAAALRGMLRGADAAFADGRQVVIFPEGTRAVPGAAPVLQPGVAALARRAPVALVPATTDSGRVWGRGRFDKRPGTIRISVLAPLPAGLERDELLSRLTALYAA